MKYSVPICRNSVFVVLLILIFCLLVSKIVDYRQLWKPEDMNNIMRVQSSKQDTDVRIRIPNATDRLLERDIAENVESLTLRKPKLTIDGWKIVTSKPNLSYLDISGANGATLSSFADVISETHHLTLEWLLIDSENAVALRFPRLSGLLGLKHLILSHMSFTSDSDERFEPLENLEDVVLQFVQFDEHSTHHLFQSIRNVKDLKIVTADLSTNGAISLSEFPFLRTLTLSTENADEYLPHLCQIQTLETLCFESRSGSAESYPVVSAPSLSCLSEIKGLKTLSVSGPCLLPDDFVLNVSKLNKLEKLSLSNVSFENAETEIQLRESLPKTEVVCRNCNVSRQSVQERPMSKSDLDE